MSDDAAERARRRRNWPGRVVRKHEPAQLDCAVERVASMWQLAVDAWTAQGRELPEYTRSTMPGRVIVRE